MITAGRVRVNGKSATLGIKADPAKDMIEFDCKPIAPTEPLVYIALYKPCAAFRGINLMANGYGDEAGLGKIMALDIRGATTDFYSNGYDYPLYQFPVDEVQ